MTHIKTYKFRLQPTKEQSKTFSSWLGGTRYVYNLCLDYKSTVYKSNGTSLSKNDIQKELRDIKNEIPWLKEINAQVIQETTDRLYRSYDNFFRRVKGGETPGFPKFARKGLWNSFTFKQDVKVHPNTSRISLPKMGKVKFRKSQEVLGTVKTATIKRQADGWFVCITSEVDDKHLPTNEHAIGIDLGLKDLVITSEGEVMGNPRTLRLWSEKLVDVQRELSRKKKGSKNRNKTKRELSRLHQKISDIRKDYLHKLTTNIVSENQVIVCEDLNVKGLMRRCKPKKDEDGKFVPNGQAAKSGLNRSIADASWGQLVSMLEYKSQWAGRQFVKVPAHYTSQDCNECGWRNKELTLADREWICTECGVVHDRDINAALNIRERGLKKLKEAGHVFSTLGDIDPIRDEAEEPLTTL